MEVREVGLGLSEAAVEAAAAAAEGAASDLEPSLFFFLSLPLVPEDLVELDLDPSLLGFLFLSLLVVRGNEAPAAAPADKQ